MLCSVSSEELAFLKKTEVTCQSRTVAFTPIRRAVLTLLYRHPSGLGAYDLLDLIKKVKPKSSPPTIYRALAFLTDQGLARKINCINVYVCCDRKKCEGHQSGVFLVCPLCKSVSELVDTKIKAGIAKRLSASGHTLDERKFEISAVCPACQTDCAAGL